MKGLLRRVFTEAERRLTQPVTPPLPPRVGASVVRAHLARRHAFEVPATAEDLVTDVVGMLSRWGVSGGHPRNFGLSGQGVDAVGVAAAAVTALFDPQLAVWDASPAAVEMERHVLAVLARHLGLPPETEASFTTGASEATHCALVVALSQTPGFARRGLRGVTAWPTVYVSTAGHPSLVKLAHAVGIGRDAVKRVPVDTLGRMDVAALTAFLARDRAAGEAPSMVVATAGATETGAIDPLDALATVCAHEGLWLHVDAAWGGALAMVPALAPLLAGIARADSVAWDAHKGLGAPGGTGMFFCRHPDKVAAAFGVHAAYMPRQDSAHLHPYARGLQWSRRFAGLSLFMAMAVHGKGGMTDRVAGQVDLGNRLRARLVSSGWAVLNTTVLPVVCATHPALRGGSVRPQDVVRAMRRRGIGWIAVTTLPGDGDCLRMCVSSQATRAEDVDALVEGLNAALATPRT